MSTDLIEVLNRLGNLSIEELLTVQETVRKGVQQKIHSSKSPEVSDNHVNGRVIIPGAYRPTIQEVEAHLARVFTPEQLAEISRTEISNITLPPGAKTTAEILSEDREDRF